MNFKLATCISVLVVTFAGVSAGASAEGLPNYQTQQAPTGQQAPTEQHAQTRQDAVGGPYATGSSASGESATWSMPMQCTGPANFCNIFSGS